MKRIDFKKILKDLNKKNVALIGHMGSGKSLIGKLISEKFNISHVDTDLEIVKYTKMSINEIFIQKGEKYFRDTESKIVKNLLLKNNIILSLGGGSILDPSIRGMLQKYSVTFFLDIKLTELEKRLKNTNKRPLLQNTNIMDKIKQLDSDRRKYYLLADIKIRNLIKATDICQNLVKQLTDLHEKDNQYQNQK